MSRGEQLLAAGGQWLPELRLPAVVRTLVGPVEDVILAVTPISVVDLPTFRARCSWAASGSCHLCSSRLQYGQHTVHLGRDVPGQAL